MSDPRVLDLLANGQLLHEYLVPVPRCLSKIRCVCKSWGVHLRDKLESDIVYRIFRGHLHHQVRLTALQTFSKFALSNMSISYNTSLVRVIFKLLFRENSPNDEIRVGAMKMLMEVSPKYKVYMFSKRKIRIRPDSLLTQEYRCTSQTAEFERIKRKIEHEENMKKICVDKIQND